MQITAKRFTSLSSCPWSVKGYFEVSSVSLYSRNQYCWSSTATASSESFLPQHGRKVVTKQERSAMVLAFVDKYRALNDGNFPSASCIQKQVGGSYYVIRAIIQELEHNHKRPSPETKAVNFGKEKARCEVFSLTEEPCISADVEQTFFKDYVGHTTEVRKLHSSNKSKQDAKTSRLSIETHSEDQIDRDAQRMLAPQRVGKEKRKDNGLYLDNFCASFSPAAMSLQTDASTGTADAGAMNANVGDQASSKLETNARVFHISPLEKEIYGKDAASAANLQKEAFRSEEFYRNQQLRVTEGAPSTKKLKFWENLKSLAVGMINRWKS